MAHTAKRTGQRRRKVVGSTREPTVQNALLHYLLILKGGRTQDVLASAMGVKRAQAGHVLNRRSAVSGEHLDAISTTWGIDPSKMFKQLARVAQNLEMGLAPDDGITKLPEMTTAGVSERKAG